MWSIHYKYILEPGQRVFCALGPECEKRIKVWPGKLSPYSSSILFRQKIEKILCRRLVSLLHRNKILYCDQYGFRKLYSTVLVLIEITDYIKRPLDVISVLIDFKMTFDTVDHEIVLYKLECHGIHGLVNDFVRSYLTNRRQYTIINGVNSELRTVSCGVQQCSVLRALCFLLYINDLYKSIGHESLRVYADDTAIITSSSNLDIAQKQAREMFMKLYHWCVANKLSINNDKTNFVLFHMKTKPFPKYFNCTKQMQCKSTESILYSIWEYYLMNIYIDTSKSIRFAHPLWNTLGFLIIWKIVSLRISKQLYYAFIYFRIQYGIEAYRSCAKETMSKLQIIQNKLLKLLLNWDRRSPPDLVHKELPLLKIDDVHIARVLFL